MNLVNKKENIMGRRKVKNLVVKLVTVCIAIHQHPFYSQNIGYFQKKKKKEMLDQDFNYLIKNNIPC
ncbi:hypothetical protein RFI_08228 [Reticulomyxa filosa]|uniref:Uncharacterized protein n=1 Tax=Reticulomyxa filosa TaxID=46433 RepID=X6NUH9_RETFI|nr:hypothetical protein RFI_08228 [Reticulomyxa filosa]|eukprot:ETO28902.1 hypothetical protein RFI_08228 [Reticulomyxa filosa]